MHPDIPQLLEQRDGRASATIAEHVATCAQCQRELLRLQQLRKDMQELPEIPVPDRVWQGIAARKGNTPRGWRIPGLALAASVVLAVALTVTRVPETPDPGVLPQNALTTLAAQSDDLERLLASLDPDARALDLETANTIVALEDRIAVVDSHLHRATLETADAEVLWKQRVDLMQALVGVHLAGARYEF